MDIRHSNAEDDLREIDFSGFYSGDEQLKNKTCEEVFQAIVSDGVVQLYNHNVNVELIDNVFTQSKLFFQLPLADKMKLGLESNEANRGYIAQGQEKLKFENDIKESFEIGNEKEKEFPNKWPTEMLSSEFRSTMIKYFEALDGLFLDVMRCIAVGLKLTKEYFTELCNKQHENLRLLHYPTLNRSEEHQERFTSHFDISAMALLSQDQTGGLQIKNRRTERWISVLPEKGVITVLVGEMLKRWTNDLLLPAEHRVGITPGLKGEVVPERFSTAFFANANKDVMLDAIPGTYSEDRPKKYEPVTSIKFLTDSLANAVGTQEEFLKITTK